MPLAELYPWVDNNDRDDNDLDAYENMSNQICRGMGMDESEKRKEEIFAILAQDEDATSLTAKLDEEVPQSVNIVTQITAPKEVGLKQHLCLVFHAREHVGGLIVAAGKTARLRDEEIGNIPQILRVRDKIGELMARDNISPGQVHQVVVKGPVARWPETALLCERLSRVASALGVTAAFPRGPTWMSNFDPSGPCEERLACCTAGEELDHCRIIIIANEKEPDRETPLSFPGRDYMLRAFTVEVPEGISSQELSKLVRNKIGPSNRFKSFRWVYGFCKVDSIEVKGRGPETQRVLQNASGCLRSLDMTHYKHLYYVGVGGEAQDLNILCVVALQTNLLKRDPAKEAKKRKQCVVS